MSDEPRIETYIGQTIRRARHAKALRQEDLAVLLGIERSTLAKYELGERSMSVDTLAKIARVLKKPIGDFFPQELR